MATKKKKTTKKTAVKKATVNKAPAKKTATKKKAVKSQAVKRSAVKSKATKKPAAKSRAANAKIKVTSEQLHKMICEAAYYISLDRTSETVHPTDDWLQAETAINKICTVQNN